MHRTQIAGSAIDQCRFGSAQGVRAELERIEADAGDPLIEKAGILTCREASTVITTGKQEVDARFLRNESDELRTPKSVCLDARERHHLGPLRGFLRDELPEISRRAREHNASEITKARLQFGIGEPGIDFPVELSA